MYFHVLWKIIIIQSSNICIDMEKSILKWPSSKTTLKEGGNMFVLNSAAAAATKLLQSCSPLTWRGKWESLKRPLLQVKVRHGPDGPVTQGRDCALKTTPFKRFLCPRGQYVLRGCISGDTGCISLAVLSGMRAFSPLQSLLSHWPASCLPRAFKPRLDFMSDVNNIHGLEAATWILWAGVSWGITHYLLF